MTNDNFVYIDVGSVADPRLTNIDCPECHRGYLKVSKFDATKLICFECGVKIDEREVMKDQKLLPSPDLTGMGFGKKPFFNQVNANHPLGSGGNERGAYAVDDGSLYEQAKKTSFNNMGNDSNIHIQNKGGRKIDPQTLNLIKKVAGRTGQIIDISIE